jgi:hypothetical protein
VAKRGRVKQDENLERKECEHVVRRRRHIKMTHKKGRKYKRRGEAHETEKQNKNLDKLLGYDAV